LVEKHSPFVPFLLLLCTIGILLAFSVLIPKFLPLGYQVKDYNLFSELISDPAPIKNKASRSVSKTVPSPIANVVKAGTPPPDLQDFSKDSTGGLLHFMAALSATKKTGKATRIAYFGDSMIEGDILTQDLRNNLQNVFGGQGVGFVPITSITAGFRQSIRQSFSDNWITGSLIGNEVPSSALGISGYVFFPAFKRDSLPATENSWVNFNACPNYKSLEKFHTLNLFYGKSPAGKNFVQTKADGKFQQFALAGGDVVNSIRLHDSIPFKNISLHFQCNSPLEVYGASFESKTGLFLDNFSFRGNSGLPLTKISMPVLKNFNTLLHYDLIVVHYGLNVANTQMKDYSWYQAGMIRVVNYLKSCFPQSSFLLISVGDKSYKNGMVYETDPSIPILVESQRQVAAKTGVAFWNLYEGMGGRNSMLSWVDTLVPLANKDYAHLNFKGGKKVADMLFQHFMHEFTAYEKTQKVQ
jgi:hypothetical protein